MKLRPERGRNKPLKNSGKIMAKKEIKFVQAQLNARGLDAGPEDGILGQRTLDALNRVEGIPAQWSKTRKAVAFIQMLAKENGIETGDVDGYWGPPDKLRLWRALAGSYRRQ